MGEPVPFAAFLGAGADIPFPPALCVSGEGRHAAGYKDRGKIYGNPDKIYDNIGKIYDNIDKIYDNISKIYDNLDKIYDNAGKIYGNLDKIYDNLGKIYGNAGKIYEDRGMIYGNVGGSPGCNGKEWTGTARKTRKKAGF